MANMNNPDIPGPDRVPADGVGGEPVAVWEAASEEEAEVVTATLQAAGIPAELERPEPTAGMGTVGEGVAAVWRNRVFVAPEQAEAARAVLSAIPFTTAELTAEEEADPETLEHAEARVHDA
ncbi:MAG: hypothetical protein KGJ62_06900 [Armatimonadetes bacterium]|nr:hypothetical protein [Armatimonadota bacterium]MDE2206263.1 hypothetical protein [Armatimonadota bacterium]